MADLPPVVQRFIAEAADYLGPVLEMIAETESLAAAVDHARDEIKKMNDMVMAAAKIAAISDPTLITTKELNQGALRYFRQIQQEIMDASLASKELEKTFGDYVDAVVAARGPTDSYFASIVRGGWFGRQALHWIVMGGLELLSTVVPALLGLGAGLSALYQPFAQIGDRMHALYIASHSFTDMIRNSSSPVAALAGNMQRLMNTVTPSAFTIFGAAIDAVTTKTGLFNQMAKDSVTVLTNFAVSLSSTITSSGSTFNKFFGDSVHLMAQWGEVLGNLGHTILNVINAMLGIGKVLLDVFVVISRALVVITNNPFIAWLIGVAAAMSAVFRYGQLLGGIFKAIIGSQLVTQLMALKAQFLEVAVAEDTAAASAVVLDSALGIVMGFLGPMIAVVAAGAAIWGIYKLSQMGAKNSITELINRIESATPTVQNLSGGITQLSQALVKQAGTITNVSAGYKKLAENQALVGTPSARQAFFNLHTQASQAQQNIDQLTTAITKQRQKLADLIAGLAQTGAGAGAVGHYMNFLGIQTGLADSKIQQMNQSFDNFMSTLTSGEGGIAAFANSIKNITGVAATTGISNLGRTADTVTVKIKNFADALGRGAIHSTTAWQNFVQITGQTMPQLVNFLNTAQVEGALTGQQVSRAILDMTSAMIGFAAKSPAAQHVLLGFAQASDKNITTWAQLKEAIKTGGFSMQDLQKLVDKATISMSNASQVAQRLSVVLAQDFAQAAAAAALKASGFSSASFGLAEALRYGSFQGQNISQWITKVHDAENRATTMTGQMSRAMGGASGSMGNLAGAASTAHANVYQLWSIMSRLNGMVVNATVRINTVGGVSSIFGGGLPGGTAGGVNPGGPHGPHASIVGLVPHPGAIIVNNVSNIVVQGSVHTQQSLANAIQDATLSRAFINPGSGLTWRGRRL